MKKNNLLSKWKERQAKYGALLISFSCLCTVIISWGNNWVLTSILGLGVLICGSLGIFDIRRAIKR
ncbi:hypothetical protein CYL18_15575 [Pradoshia eiseniae]|uniref:Uncharacterized protein n=1 Tax=Pradoshia eiseniae TaxID=2064768 RepID=A0A2S7MWY0_9BACI|nr:hypothetical protein CYL18_15575 [Pradoshia eiseniae]